MTGFTLGQYCVGEKLGEGGMCAVYKATDQRLLRPAALKVPRSNASGGGIASLMAEARAASVLNHPNIVTIYDVGHANGIDFIAMEYVPGEPLDSILARGPVPAPQLLDYGIQIATALMVAHAAGVVHRDIKPGNVLVGRAGILKVLDFGLATLVATGAENLTSTLEDHPICGTLGYMAPEQVMGRVPDERADIFSFGALLYEMSTGYGAFTRKTAPATISAILNEDPEPMSRLNREVSCDLERLVMSCLRKDPARRIASMADVKCALEALAGTRPAIPPAKIHAEESMAHILVVEDEPAIALGLEDDLTLEGYHVTVVGNGETASHRGRDERFDLILLDVMLPRKDGFTVCRELRRAGVRTPILMLTAKAQEAEKVMGLDLGADDYVSKPFSPHELRARVRALLRRSVSEPKSPDIYRFGPNELDVTRAELRRDGVALEATPLELKLLSVLVRNRGRLMTREYLLEQVWGRGVAVTDRVVDNQILALRKKIEPTPAEPRFLVSVRGMGYRFDG
jgi:DNA-binding response OmpR family regulator/predicted Ser/Thr protein kinase